MTQALGGKLDSAAFLSLTRPGNLVITALSVLIAGIISHAQWRDFTLALLLAALSASLIAAGGNVYNDYCDRDLDLRQKSHRPLPAGRITPRSALRWSEILFLSGLAIAPFINLPALIIAAVAALLLVLYSRFWKGQPLIGNLAVALISGLAFVYGGVSVHSLRSALCAAWLAFLFHLGREIIKDMEDREGDALHQAHTLIVRYGMKPGRLLISAIFLLLAVSLPLLYGLGGFQSAYLIIVLLGILPVILFAGVLVWVWSEPKQLHLLGLVLKVDMLVGLAALFLGRPYSAGA